MDIFEQMDDMKKNILDEHITTVKVAPCLAWYWVLGLSMASMAMLYFSFAPFGGWYLAYIAIVPWAAAMGFARSTRAAVLIGWICGAIYWAASVYWLILPTGVGYVAVVAYLSLYWLAGSYVVRRCVIGRVWMWFWLPVIFVTMEFIRAHVVSFEWFFLSQTQYENLRLIQVADVTGQYGVSFFVGMADGLLLDAVVWRVGGGSRKKLICGLAIVVASLAGMLIYGGYRMNQHATSRGPVVGIVQSAEPISLENAGQGPDKVLDKHIRMSMELLGKGCDVVLWSETMLPAGMNPDVLDVNVSKLSDAEVVSLVGGIFNKTIARAHDVKYLRRYLLLALGNITQIDGRSYGCRYFLENYLSSQQYGSLDDGRIAKLCAMLLGRQAEPLSPSQRRLAVGLYVSNADLKNFKPEDFKKLLQPHVDAYVMTLNVQDTTQLAEICRRTLVKVSPNVIGLELISLRVSVEVVRACSVSLGCDIIAGGSTLHPNPQPIEADDQWVIRNSVLLFSPSGREEIYSKIHLVPFSEYVIGKYSCKPLYDICRSFVPAVMPQLSPGKELARFHISDAAGSWQLATPICFEGTFSRICRRIADSGVKSNLVLANISNDGWFVWKVGEKYVATTEHSQHLVHYVFRAIENRLPVVRAVNTGISGYIDSDGRIRYLPGGVEKFNSSVMLRAVDAVPTLVDSRRSIYTVYGDFFPLSAAAVALAGVLWYFAKRSLRRSKGYGS